MDSMANLNSDLTGHFTVSVLTSLLEYSLNAVDKKIKSTTRR